MKNVEKDKNDFEFYVVIVCVIILISIVIGFLLYKSINNEKVENNTPNINVVEQDNKSDTTKKKNW